MAQIDQFFQHLVSTGGSDLHLSEGEPPKMRVHGGISNIREEILTHSEMETMLTEIATENAWKRYISSGDLDFAYEMDADSRFRCNPQTKQWLRCRFPSHPDRDRLSRPAWHPDGGQKIRSLT